MKRLARRVEIAAAILVLLPLLAALFDEIFLRVRHSAFAGDYALLEVNVRRALHGRQLLGPYSRFQWAHPGPLYFYVVAPFYVAFRQRSEALHLVAAFLGTASVIATIALAAKRVVSPIARAFGLVVLSFLLRTVVADFSFSDPWNPHVTVLPFVAFFFLAAHVTDPAARGLGWLAFVWAFLAQTHLGNAPLVTAILVASLLIRLPRARKPLRDLGRFGLASLVAWLPPLVEELTRRPGNLTKLVDFFRTYPGLHPVLHTVGYSTQRIVHVYLPRWSIRNGLNLLVGIEIALVVSAVLGARRRKPAAAFAALVAVALPAAFLAATRIREEFDAHLTPIYPTLLPLAVFALGWSLLPDLRRSRSAVFALASLVPIFAFARDARAIDVERGKLTSLDAPDADDARVFTTILAPVLRDLRDVRVTSEGDGWAVQAGVVLRLDKEGITPPIDPAWAFQLGDEHLSGPTRVEIVIHDDPMPDLVPIAVGRSATLSLRRPPKSLGRATIRATAGVIGDPSLAVDGLAFEGSRFDAPTSLRLTKSGSLTLDLDAPNGVLREAQGVHVTADHNDTYRIEGSNDGTTFQTLGFLPMALGDGVRTRDFYFREPVSIVRISPGEGDGLYAISEIAPIYAPRAVDRIVFGLPTSRDRLLEGFGDDESGEEGPFVWATAKTARLELHLEEGRGCPIRLVASPFEAAGLPAQTLTIESAGVSLATLSLSPETSIHQFDLPANLAHSRTELTFRFGYAKSPHETIPSSQDIRTLAASFRVLEACPGTFTAEDLR